ncbi:unnamed protein product [Somion occarium]|uniref:Uncharacterized protein n=1 Tax=Somion occarium TaxID=3059160 RepID=A0ABP1E0A2_9APHY
MWIVSSANTQTCSQGCDIRRSSAHGSYASSLGQLRSGSPSVPKVVMTLWPMNFFGAHCTHLEEMIDMKDAPSFYIIAAKTTLNVISRVVLLLPNPAANPNAVQANWHAQNPFSEAARTRDPNSLYPGWGPNPSGDPRLNPQPSWGGSAAPRVNPNVYPNVPEHFPNRGNPNMYPTYPNPSTQSNTNPQPMQQNAAYEHAFQQYKPDAVTQARTLTNEAISQGYFAGAATQARQWEQEHHNQQGVGEWRRIEKERNKEAQKKVKEANEANAHVGAVENAIRASKNK